LSKHIYIPVTIGVVATILVCGATVHFASKSKKYWAEIKSRSENHEALGSAYIACRRKLFSEDTREECLLMAKDYADLAGIEDSIAREVLLEIKAASDNYGRK